MTAYKMTEVRAENVYNAHARKSAKYTAMMCVAHVVLEPPLDERLENKVINQATAIGRRISKTPSLAAEYDSKTGEVTLRGVHRNCNLNDPVHLEMIARIGEQTVREFIEANGDTVVT